MTNDDGVLWLSLGFRGWQSFSVIPLKQIAFPSFCSISKNDAASVGAGGCLLIFVAWRIVPRQRRGVDRLIEVPATADNAAASAAERQIQRQRVTVHARLNTVRRHLCTHIPTYYKDWGIRLVTNIKTGLVFFLYMDTKVIHCVCTVSS